MARQSELTAFVVYLYCVVGAKCLHNLEINVPRAALAGSGVTLECSWQLEDDETLYSVKWYRGRDEFYRYIPKELPHTRVFPQPGIEVDISRSGARRVVLQRVGAAAAGRYRCEVSADAPTFHTEIRNAPLEVVEGVGGPPRLVADHAWYGVGATLRAVCVAPPSAPPANISITLNGREIPLDTFSHTLPDGFTWDPRSKSEPTTEPPRDADSNFNMYGDDNDIQYLDESYINLHKEEIRRPPKLDQKINPPNIKADSKQPSVGKVSFLVTNESFERGLLRLTCIASIYELYSSRTHLIFDMEQPEVASVLGVRNNGEDLTSRRIWRIAISLTPFLYIR